jgi:pyruvate/2-oxoglutarate/acetoin dehydrogenase E1 component
VHDAVGPFGAGGEIAALAADHGFDTLRAPIRRVAAPFAPVPFPPDLEAAYFPRADRIAGVARELVLNPSGSRR